eukprot:333112-Chlamydomonas_euryale.AAC.1
MGQPCSGATVAPAPPLNGVAGAGGHDLVPVGACSCGWGRRRTARNRLTFGARLPSGIVLSPKK